MRLLHPGNHLASKNWLCHRKTESTLHYVLIFIFNSLRKILLPFIYSLKRVPFYNPQTLSSSSVQSLSRVQLFATPWIAARQASLSITNSWSLLKLMPIESVMPSSHLTSVVPFSSCPQSLPASGSFPMNQLFARGGQSTGVSTLVSVLPMNTQDWSPLGWTGWISFQSKGLSRVFSNTVVQRHQFFGTQLSSQSNSHIHTWPLEKP